MRKGSSKGFQLYVKKKLGGVQDIPTWDKLYPGVQAPPMVGCDLIYKIWVYF